MTMHLASYEEKYQDQVGQLIITIQRDEFGIPITLEDQPDLKEIPSFYQSNRGAFLVALDGDKVIGTLGLLDLQNDSGAIRKFFVHPDYRGKHSEAAKSLTEKMLSWGKENSYRAFFLGTTEKFLGAHRFYEKNGFIEILPSELPENFPIMAVDKKFYKYEF